MKKVTEYELLRKAQHLAQNLTELSSGFPQDDRIGLGQQMTAISLSMPAILIAAGNDSNSGYLSRIQRVADDNEDLSHILLLAREKEFISFDQWQRWSDELRLFGRMLAAMIKSLSYQPDPLSLTFTTDLYLHQ
jgi:four helix bundle protein